MTDNKIDLGRLLQSIEKFLGIRLSDFPVVFGFGAQAEFDVCDFVDRTGPLPWNSVHIETGLFSSRTAYEPGHGSHWGEILFYASDEKGFVVLLDPEVPVGLVFQSSDKAIIENAASWRRDFYYSIDWRRECYTDAKRRSYVDQWATKLESLTNISGMENDPHI